VRCQLQFYDLPTFERFVARMPDRCPPDESYSDVAQLGLEDIPRITAELPRRGYAEKEIRLVLSENWLRVCREIWKRGSWVAKPPRRARPDGRANRRITGA
jgi:hypothetical protein